MEEHGPSVASTAVLRDGCRTLALRRLLQLDAPATHSGSGGTGPLPFATPVARCRKGLIPTARVLTALQRPRTASPGEGRGFQPQLPFAREGDAPDSLRSPRVRGPA